MGRICTMLRDDSLKSVVEGQMWIGIWLDYCNSKESFLERRPSAVTVACWWELAPDIETLWH